MRLSDLSPSEIAFLSQPLQTAAGPSFADRLMRGLAAALSARLRTAIALFPVEAQPGDATPAPRWQIDARLAGLWLGRRLGGRPTGDTAPFVPQGLQDTLNDVLAERWLDAPGPSPETFAWRVQSQDCDAVLRLDLPQTPMDMTRWAKERISR